MGLENPSGFPKGETLLWFWAKEETWTRSQEHVLLELPQLGGQKESQTSLWLDFLAQKIEIMTPCPPCYFTGFLGG